MNVIAFRHLYRYHLAENRHLWESYVLQLTPEQFTRTIPYSLGSVRNQIVHLMSVDAGWFGALQGKTDIEPLNPDDFNDFNQIRAYWNTIEQQMSDYLATLTDERLSQKPFDEGEDKELVLWQVLFHVANHGTDHRAQILRILHDFGIKTTSQDYIFFVYDNPE